MEGKSCARRSGRNFKVFVLIRKGECSRDAVILVLVISDVTGQIIVITRSNVEKIDTLSIQTTAINEILQYQAIILCRED